MPTIDMDDSGYDTSSRLAAAVPYKWEAIPGQPILEASPATTELRRTPLPPPPGSSGARRQMSFVEPTFDGFEPGTLVAKSAGPHLVEKVFRKLVRLRNKSAVVASCFSLENLRALTEQRKRTFADQDIFQRHSYDSDEPTSRWSASTFDQPDTPTSSTYSFSSSSSSESMSYPSVPHQPGSQIMANVLLSLSTESDEDNDHTEYDEDRVSEHQDDCVHGAQESTLDESEEEEDLTEQEWTIVRYASFQAKSSCSISTLVRQTSLCSVTDHSYRFSPMKGRPSEAG